MSTARGAADRRPHALLLTGAPGVGKTTVLRGVAAALGGRRLGGFLTDEIREHGARVGFAISGFDGTTAVLAHVRSRSSHRVGRYGVDLAALDTITARALAPEPAPDVYLVDEIGKMECLSASFVAAIGAILDAPTLLVASIALQGAGLIASAKRRPDAEVWELTVSNRDVMPEQIVGWIAARPRP